MTSGHLLTAKNLGVSALLSIISFFSYTVQGTNARRASHGDNARELPQP